MSEIKTEKISLNVDDNTKMSSYTSMPKDKNKHAGIIVFQEAFGVNSYIRDVTERFAKLGFIAIAPELFHRSAEGFEGDYNDFDGVRKHMSAITNEGLINDIKASFNWLTDHPQILSEEICTVGFCLGGKVSFLANSSVYLKAAVSFYGGGINTMLDKTKDLKAPHLFFWGGLDKHITQDIVSGNIDSLNKNNKKYVNVVFSDADHGFFCDQRGSYNKNASTQAWVLVQEFLNTYVNYK